MKREKLCDAMNLLPDDIIHETENVRAGKKRGNKTWLKWGTAVACLCLVIIGTLTLPMLRQSPGGEHDEPATDNYPYNDTDVLDYIGMPLEDLETDNGTVVFNEITDIEAYRKFNTNYGYEDKPYYSTRTTAYDFLTWYPVASENDFINVAIFERDGSGFSHRAEAGMFPACEPRDPLQEVVVVALYHLSKNLTIQVSGK